MRTLTRIFYGTIAVLVSLLLAACGPNGKPGEWSDNKVLTEPRDPTVLPKVGPKAPSEHAEIIEGDIITLQIYCEEPTTEKAATGSTTHRLYVAKITEEGLRVIHFDTFARFLLPYGESQTSGICGDVNQIFMVMRHEGGQLRAFVKRLNEDVTFESHKPTFAELPTNIREECGFMQEEQLHILQGPTTVDFYFTLVAFRHDIKAIQTRDIMLEPQSTGTTINMEVSPGEYVPVRMVSGWCASHTVVSMVRQMFPDYQIN